MKTIKIVLMALAIIGVVVGGSATLAKSDSLSASFMGDVNTGAAPLTVHFTDTSGGNPTAWHWDFGDGSSSTLRNPVYTYNTPGTYTVTLTVTDGAQSDTMSGDVVVTNPLVTTPTPTTTPVIVRPIPVIVKDPHHAQPPHDVDKPHKQPTRPDNPVHKQPTARPTVTPGDHPRHR